MTETSTQNNPVKYGNWIRRMGADERILTSHVSLFTAVFVFWQQQGYASPFSVNRRSLMIFSRIGSIATYHKCICELDAFGYIRYQPSYHPKLGSLVWLPDTINS